MIKKVLFAGAICAMTLLASCGGNTDNQQQPAEEEVVGEVVEAVDSAGDTIVGDIGEAVQQIAPNDTTPAQGNATDAVPAK